MADQDDRRQRKRRRGPYKAYGEVDFVGPVPRSTAWNIDRDNPLQEQVLIHPPAHEQDNVEAAGADESISDFEDLPQSDSVSSSPSGHQLSVNVLECIGQDSDSQSPPYLNQDRTQDSSTSRDEVLGNDYDSDSDNPTTTQISGSENASTDSEEDGNQRRRRHRLELVMEQGDAVTDNTQPQDRTNPFHDLEELGRPYIGENYHNGIESEGDSQEDEAEDHNEDPAIEETRLEEPLAEHVNQQEQCAPPPPPTTTLLKNRLDNEYGTVVQDLPAASRGEILLNSLEFCTHHTLSVQAQEDLHRLINSVFHKEIIPDTKYKLDKLYTGPDVITHHFFCSNCFHSFGQINHKVVKLIMCENCKAENKVGDLTTATYFITINIANQLQLLLNDPNIACHLKNPKELIANRTGDVMSDMHDGQMYRDFANSLVTNVGELILSFTMCTDGTPLFRSSNLSIWPIFIMINELPPKIRMSHIILIGLWFSKHPQMELFLDGFVDSVSLLSDPGITLRVNGVDKLCKCYVIACCVDSGARGSVQGIHAHNGAYPCNWCLHPGEVESNRSMARKFRVLEEAPTRRTHREVVEDGIKVLEMRARDAHVNGVLGCSPLLRLPEFDIVNGMVVDVLHWGSFGVGRQLFKLWLGLRKTDDWDPNKPPDFYIGAPDKQDAMNARIRKFCPPKEVRRMPRDLTCFSIWNAREWENVILYYSVPILIDILPNKYLRHWILFVQALYLLMRANVCKNDVDVAEIMMENFVRGTEELYGLREMTFNMHISEHAAESVRRWGALWCVSTYCFESMNGKLKEKIHAERGIPHQGSLHDSF
ncbi:hypothetical protein ONE63_009601 [Megalurothrips usitatus]|uniref:Transposase domain-containing protein n=1 Tax=Megalurothrips usitatus TaxID=439358 RepID=A0AAV7XK38_9NEOP|nr:hypothetical protein ONE63_009601 [Megalurothrips usitatus]